MESKSQSDLLGERTERRIISLLFVGQLCSIRLILPSCLAADGVGYADVEPLLSSLTQRTFLDTLHHQTNLFVNRLLKAVPKMFKV